MIIELILCIILTVLVMTGFTGGLIVDNNHYIIDEGERSVFHKACPTDGTTAVDHDAASNVQYAAERLYTSKYFRGVTDGDVKAGLGMGINYSQHVHNVRVVKGNKIFTESISSSTMKSLAEQKYISGNTVLFRPSVKVHDSYSASYADVVSKMDIETFYSKYGSRPNELTKELINEDTIISIRDDNAPVVASSKNAAADGESSGEEGGTSTFDDILASLATTSTPDKDGNFSFTFVLDPFKSTIYSRNEVSTLGGTDKLPVFHSVEITFRMSADWTPLSNTVVQVYDIEIPVIGAMTCTSSLTEIFYDVGDEDGALPEQEFFESHIDDAGETDLPQQSESPSDYLAAAFADYLNGDKTLDLSANIAIGDVEIRGLKASVDINKLNIYAKYGKLFLAYKDDRIYLSLNDIQGYIPVSSITDLINNESIKGLTSGVELPDLGELFGGDILGTVFGACEMTDEDGLTQIHMPFELGDNIKVDASIFITDEEKQLHSITGTVEALGLEIALDIKPAKNLSFPKIDSSYKDLSPVLDFVPDAIDTILNNKVYGIKGAVKVDDLNIDIDAYLDRTDGFTADATVGVLGQELGVKYVDGVIYVSVGNLGIKATADELPQLIKDVTAALELESGSLDSLGSLKNLLPDSIDGWINTVQTLTVDDSTIGVGIRIIGVPIGISLSRADGALSALTLDADVDMFGIKLNADVDLAISTPERHEVTVEADRFVPAGELTDLIPYIKDYITAPDLSLTLDGSVAIGDVTLGISGTAAINTNDLAAIGVAATINAFGSDIAITYVDGTAYIALGDKLKVKLAVADIETLMPAVEELLGEFGIELELPDLSSGTSGINIEELLSTVISAVDSLDVADDKITLVVNLDGIAATAVIDAATGDISLTGDIKGVTLDLGAKLAAQKATVAAPKDAADYSDIAELLPTLTAATDIIKAKALSADIDVSYGVKPEAGAAATDYYALKGSIAINLNGGAAIALKITELSVPGMANLNAELIFVDRTLYFKTAGFISLAFTGSLDDVRTIVNDLSGTVSEEALAKITDAIDAIDALLDKLEDKEIEKEAAKAQDKEPASIADTVKTVLDAIKAISFADGAITASADLAPLGAALALDAKVKTDISALDVSSTIGGKPLSADLKNVKAAAVIAAPDLKKSGYITLASLEPTVKTAIDIIVNKHAAADFDIHYGTAAKDAGGNLVADGNYYAAKGSLTVDLGSGLNVSLSVKELTIIDDRLPAIDLTAEITVKDGTVYISIDGMYTIALSCSFAELEAIVDELGDLIPEDIHKTIDKVINLLDTFDIATLIKGDGSTGGKKPTLTETIDKLVAIIKTVSAANVAATDKNKAYSALSAGIDLAPISDKIAKFLGADSSLAVAARLDLSELTAQMRIKGAPLAVKLTDVKNAANVTAPTGAYVSAAKLKSVIDAVIPLTRAQGFNISIADTYVFGVPLSGSLVISLPASETEAQEEPDSSEPAAPAALEGLAVKAALTYGDVGFEIIYGEDRIYLEIGGIRLTYGLTKADITSLIATLEDAIPSLDLSGATDIINKLFGEEKTEAQKKEDTKKLIDTLLSIGITLESTSDGFDATVDLDSVKKGLAIAISVATDNGALSGITASVTTSEKVINAAVEISTDDNNALTGIYLKQLNIKVKTDSEQQEATAEENEAPEAPEAPAIPEFAAKLFVLDTGVQKIAVTKDYVDLTLFTDLIKPIFGIIDGIPKAEEPAATAPAEGEQENEPAAIDEPGEGEEEETEPGEQENEPARGMTGITLKDIYINILTAQNVETAIKVDATVALKPFALSAKLTLFANTEPQTEIYATFIDSKLYLKLADIKVTLDLGDDTDKEVKNDLHRLLAIVKLYTDKGLIPQYLYDAAAGLIDPPEGEGALGDTGSLIGRIKDIAAADSISDGIKLAMSGIKGPGSDSAAKKLISMIGASFVDEEVIVPVDQEETTEPEDNEDEEQENEPAVIDEPGEGEEQEETEPETETVIVRRPVITLTPLDKLSLRLIPDVKDGKLIDLRIFTNLLGASVTVTVNPPEFVTDASPVTAPTAEEAAKYISVLDIIEVANNLISNFTTATEEETATAPVEGEEGNEPAVIDEPAPGENASATGKDDELLDITDLLKKEITFEITNFKFNYTSDEVKDSKTGNVTKAAETVKVSDGSIKAKFTKKPPVESEEEEQTGEESEEEEQVEEEEEEQDGIDLGYDIAIEAHLTLEIGSMKKAYGTLNIALYVADGEAFVEYYESETKLTERVSINFGAVLDMVGAVMQIMDVDPKVTKQLIGSEHMSGINSDVFGSMAIVGLDGVKTAIEDVANTINDAKKALGYIKTAWGILFEKDIQEADKPLDALKDRLNDTTDEATGKVVNKGILTYLKDAIKLFVEDFGKEKEPNAETVIFDSNQVAGILSGISLEKQNDDVYATVKNTVTVSDKTFSAEQETAHILVKQSENGDGVMLINGFDITNLATPDAIFTVSADFEAGKPVEIAIPEEKKKETSEGANDYSNLSDIKHLLFDILNTANMRKFEIGGEDSHIYLNASILGNIDIPYNVKVHILDRDERREAGLMNATYEYENEDTGEKETRPTYWYKTDKAGNYLDKSGNIIVDANDNPVTVDSAAETVGSVKDRLCYDYASVEPAYKTFAYVELNLPAYSARLAKIGNWEIGVTDVLPECTTRLYFYDDVFYIDGVSDWEKKEIKYCGGSTYVKVISGSWVDNIFQSTYNYYECTRVYKRITLDEAINLLKQENGLTTFLKDYLFCLVPLESGLRDKIMGLIKPSDNSSNTESSTTIAASFKGYSYDDVTENVVIYDEEKEEEVVTAVPTGVKGHNVTLDLGNLANSNNLGDLKVSLFGKGDEADGDKRDENPFDNHLYKAHIETKLINMISLRLDAVIINAELEDVTETVIDKDGNTATKTYKKLYGADLSGATIVHDWDYIYIKEEKPSNPKGGDKVNYWYEKTPKTTTSYTDPLSMFNAECYQNTVNHTWQGV